MDFAPQELFAAMPPMVQRAWVEGSTGKNSLCCFSAALRCASTMPGWTVAVAAAVSRLRIPLRCLEQSQHDGAVDGLAALAGAAAAGQDGDAGVPRQG